jgi:hypothetical protein
MAKSNRRGLSTGRIESGLQSIETVQKFLTEIAIAYPPRFATDEPYDKGDAGWDRRAAVVYLVDELSPTWAGPSTLNYWQVDQGWAWHATKFSDDKTLALLERQARAAKRGLWAAEDGREPVAPWDWRKLSKEERDLLR